jgi:hypothetical protein
MPALVQRKTAATGATNATTLTVTLDAVPTPGSLLVLHVATATSGATRTPPAGWSAANTGNDAVSMFYRVAGADEATSIQVTYSAAVQGVLIVEEWAGMVADQGTVLNVAAWHRDTTSGTTDTTPSVTTTVADTLLLALIGSLPKPFDDAYTSWSDGFVGNGPQPQSAATPTISASAATASRTVTATGTYSTTGTRSGVFASQPRAILAAFKVDTSQTAPTDAPADLAATVDGTDVTLEWDDVAGATSYEVDVDEGAPVAASSPHTVTGLTAATTYSFRVRARNVLGVGPWSTPVEATTAAEAPTVLHWAWLGQTTPTSATVSAHVDADEPVDVQLVLVDPGNPGSVLATSPVVEANAANGWTVKLTATGLTADTAYGWACLVGGDLDLAHTGSVRTFPAGPASFSFVLGSCTEDNPTLDVGPSDHPVWLQMLTAHQPRFFLQMGDFHYWNVNTTDPADHREPWDRLLASAHIGSAVRNVPTFHTWDDHDYLGDNFGSNGNGRTAARANWRAIAPGYDLEHPTGNQPIHYAFTCGRVRVLVPDTRSDRKFFGYILDPNDPDDATILGATGRQWLLDELTAADTDPDIALVVVQLGVPWIHDAEASDTWGGYPGERQLIADHIEGLSVQVLGVAGDMHAAAIDTGGNNEWGGFPFLHAAPLWYKGRSFKGGPYSYGPYGLTTGEGANTTGQFGLMTVDDDGGDLIGVTLSARRVNADGDESELASHTFQIDLSEDPPPPTYEPGWHRWDADAGDWVLVS